MIKSFKIVNNIGESISLDIRKPEDTGFLVSSVTGLTFPKSDISMSEIAMFDGATVTNRRIGARNIVMGIIFYDSNNDKNTIEELRHKCYRYFPIKQEVTFYVTNDSGTYWIKGYIEANETNIFTKAEAAQISILCPDPYFIKSDSGGTAYISKIIPNFEFPVSFEYENVRLDGYVLYEGPRVVVPKLVNQTLQTTKSYFGSNITVTKVLVQRNPTNAGGGYTAEIKGCLTPEEVQPVNDANSLEYTEYEDQTSFTPTRNDQVIETTGHYLESNLVVKKIPYTESTGSSGKTVTISGMSGGAFNPFKYHDYEGSYVIVPKSEPQTIETANCYFLRNFKVTKYYSQKTRNEAGGYTYTVKGFTNYTEQEAPLLSSDSYTKYSGSYSITPAKEQIEIQSRAQYCDQNITVAAIPATWTKLSSGTDNSYSVRIGG